MAAPPEPVLSRARSYARPWKMAAPPDPAWYRRGSRQVAAPPEPVLSRARSYSLDTAPASNSNRVSAADLIGPRVPHQSISKRDGSDPHERHDHVIQFRRVHAPSVVPRAAALGACEHGLLLVVRGGGADASVDVTILSATKVARAIPKGDQGAIVIVARTPAVHPVPARVRALAPAHARAAARGFCSLFLCILLSLFGDALVRPAPPHARVCMFFRKIPPPPDSASAPSRGITLPRPSPPC